MLAPKVIAVTAGDRFSAAGFDIAVSGGQHAVIHRDIPVIANVGYLVEGGLYHPGDSYHVPPAPVETLLLPILGAWSKLSDAVDYVRVVRPSRLVQIHEGMLNDAGQQALAHYLSPETLTELPLSIVPAGGTITV